MRNTSMILFSCVLALSACDNGGGTDAGPADSGPVGTDSGPRADGGRDAGPRDAGPSDLCATDDAISTVGCNGGILGTAQPANAFGGTCTASDTVAAGTCTATGAICGGDPGATGICLQECTPSADTYVSTGDCPEGSRCFELSGGAVCFPDCNSAADCVSNECDSEGSCVPGAPPPTDGGVPTDGGAPTDGGGVATDAGVVADGGTAG